MGCFPCALELGGGLADRFSFLAGMALAERGWRSVASTPPVRRLPPFSGVDPGAESADRVSPRAAAFGTAATGASVGASVPSLECLFFFFPLGPAESSPPICSGISPIATVADTLSLATNVGWAAARVTCSP